MRSLEAGQVPSNMSVRMLDCLTDRLDHVMGVAQGAKGANCLEGRNLVGQHPLKDDRNPARLQVLNDLLQCMGTTCVKHPDSAEAQDHDSDIGDIHQFIEEPLGRTEEQGPV